MQELPVADAEMEADNYFKELNLVNVNTKVKEKNRLKYLSWAYAWGALKQKHPNANSKVYEREDGRTYWDDGKTAWVKVGVTVADIEHVEYLPIMDFRNKSISIDQLTSFEVNKAIQRAMTKAIARHGLGLYIYAGEDLPEDGEQEQQQQQQQPQQQMQRSSGQRKLIPPTDKQKKYYVDLLNKKYQGIVPNEELLKADTMDVAAMKEAVGRLIEETKNV